jgi:hypothetical protein
MTTISRLLDAAIGEPPSTGPDLAAVVRAGRRLRRRSLARRSVGVTTAAVAVVVTATTSFTAGTAAPAWALAPSPEQVTQRMTDRLEAHLPAGVTLRAVEEHAFGAGLGNDGLPVELSRAEWSEATSWSIEATLSNGHDVVIGLAQSTEGALHSGEDPVAVRARHCREALAEQVYLSCRSTSLSTQGTSVPGVTKEYAALPSKDGVMVLTPSAAGEPTVEARFGQSLSAYPGDDFVVTATETFLAEDVGQLHAERTLQPADLADIVLDPRLLAAR